MEFIDRLGQLLDERGIDQGELESACALAHGRVSKWKAGKGEPTAAQALRIARQLGVCVEWLVEGTGERNGPNPVGEEVSEEQRLVWKLFRGSKLSVYDLAERLVHPPDKSPARKRTRKQSPRKRRQG